MSMATDKKRKHVEKGSNGSAKMRKRSRRASAYHSSSESDDTEAGPLARTAGGPASVDKGLFEPSHEAPIKHVKTVGTRASDPKPKRRDRNDNSQDENEASAGEDSLSEDDELDRASEGEVSGDSGSSDDGAAHTRKKKKRNDPSVFATSISKILSSKLTASKRADPVLSRSQDASNTAKEVTDVKLEAKARRKLRDDNRTAREKGRVKDVLGVERSETGNVAELEKRLKKTAQRGVIKLFNAVRAAQVQAEEAEREVKQQGVIGAEQRKEKVNEMSKKGLP